MSKIDYSKWDKFENSSGSSNDDHSSDEEQENNGLTSGHRGAPQVTRLEYPTRVTIQPSGVRFTRAPSKASASPFNSSASPVNRTPAEEIKNDLQQGGSSISPPLSEQTSHDRFQERIDAADDDEELLYESLARNGGREGTQHWWSQTEDSATVSFLIPWDTTANMITEFSLREVKDEASDQFHAQLEVTIQTSSSHTDSAVKGNEAKPIASSTMLHICHQFRYPIKLSEELVEGCWQLQRMPHRHVRLLVVEVFKEPIGEGMTLWWDRCFVSDTISVVDTQKIPDRVPHSAAAGQSAQEKVEQFRAVWNEAHDEFRRRMKERKSRQQ